MAQCPVILQLSALLGILHHDDGQLSASLRDVGGAGELDGHGCGHEGEPRQQTPPGLPRGMGRRAEGKGKTNKGKSAIKEEDPNHTEILKVVTKLVLRHEDTLQCQAMRPTFSSTGPGSVLKLMTTKTLEWHQAPQTDNVRGTSVEGPRSLPI